MLIMELAAEIHQNAVEHGWWDEKRAFVEIIALIHSEWSEALEETRAGRPLSYRVCLKEPEETVICGQVDETFCARTGREKECKYYGKKPEGIAVELVDGCIRILDYLARCGYFEGMAKIYPERGKLTAEDFCAQDEMPDAPMSLPEAVSKLHAMTTDAYRMGNVHLENACRLAMRWVKQQGMDPVQLILEKHAYNKTRPFKHGKKF